MSEAQPTRRPLTPLPPEYVVDSLTWYIYRHFASLLTEDELAAQRVRTGRVKQMMSSEPEERRMRDFYGERDAEAKFPELMRRLNERGPASVMREAAERVLRDNPEKKILHNCAKCGELCLTPKARFCLACGFSWHSTESGGAGSPERGGP